MPYKSPFVNIGISPDLHRLLVFHAQMRGVTIAEVANHALIKGLIRLAEDEPLVDGGILSPPAAAALLKDLDKRLRLKDRPPG